MSSDESRNNNMDDVASSGIQLGEIEAAEVGFY